MLPTETIGPYHLLHAAGNGVSGTVYRAVDGRNGRPVALKLMRALRTDTASARRFDAEVRVLQSLDHQDIVRLLDHGHWMERPWMAMQWLPGHDLTRYTSVSRLLPDAVVLDIGARLAAALNFAHERGVIHRDVKPGNIRVHLTAGRVMLADFGVARHEDAAVTPTGVVLGTPAYMAPEVTRGGLPDTRADLYSLGILLFELLTGRRPFAAANMGEWLRQIAHEPVPDLRAIRPELPGELAAVVAALLQRDPTRRPATGNAVSASLRAVRATLPERPWVRQQPVAVSVHGA